MQQIILELLSSQPAFQKLADEIRSGNTQDQLGLAGLWFWKMNGISGFRINL